jgi:hypothetical protein
VATLSDALFEQPYNDQTSSLTGFETSSQQAENLAQGDNLNLAISGYDMYTDGYIARTFGVLTTTEYMTRVFGDAKSSLRPIFAREWPDAFFIAEHYMTNTHPSVYISDQLACLVDYVVRNHGAVVPQRMWSPSHPSDTRRYVMHEPLNMPIFFVKDDRRTLGLRVVAAAAGDCMGLLSARATAPVGSLHATTLRIMVSTSENEYPLDIEQMLSVSSGLATANGLHRSYSRGPGTKIWCGAQSPSECCQNASRMLFVNSLR